MSGTKKPRLTTVNNANEPCARSQRSPLLHASTTAQKSRSNRLRSAKASHSAHVPVASFVHRSLQRSIDRSSLSEAALGVAQARYLTVGEPSLAGHFCARLDAAAVLRQPMPVSMFPNHANNRRLLEGSVSNR